MKPQINNLLKCFFVLDIAVVLAFGYSCSDRLGSPGSASVADGGASVIGQKAQGYIIDSPVQGLRYLTEGGASVVNLEGTTDAAGKFEYLRGYPVGFYVGDVKLGQLTLDESGDSYITPVHFDGFNDFDSEKTARLLRLFQSLDNDGNLDNGIQITSVQEKEIEDSAFTLENIMSGKDIVSDLAGDIKTRFIARTASQARIHMQDSVRSLFNAQLNKLIADHAQNSNAGRIDAEKLQYALPAKLGTFPLTWSAPSGNNFIAGNLTLTRPQPKQPDMTADITVDIQMLNILSFSRSIPIFIKALPLDVKSLEVDASADDAIALGRKRQIVLNAILENGNTDNLTNYVTWTSSNTGIATVSQGLITAISEGTTKITAVYQGKIPLSVSFDLTVGPKEIDRIKIIPENPALDFYGAGIDLSLSATYSDNTNAALSADSWEAEDTTADRLVSVSSAGKVIVTVNATGTDIIAAVYQGQIYRTAVSVTFRDISKPTNAQLAVRKVNGFVIPQDGNKAYIDITADDDYGVVGYYVSESNTTPAANAPEWKAVPSVTSYAAKNTEITLTGVAETDDNNQSKTLYIWFKDAFGNISDVTSDTYKLSTPILYTDQTNPLTKYQWHLKNSGQSAFAHNSGTSGNDINVENVHNTQGLKGRGIKIAFIDTGIESGHEDMAGSQINIGDESAVVDRSRGTANAGLIVMTANNSKGGVGVAPKADLYSYAFADKHPVTLTEETSFIGNTLVNINSMGYAHFYKDGSADRSDIYTGIHTAISGSNRVYIKATGDNFYSDITAETCSLVNGCQNTAHDPRNAVPNLITVGALNASGQKASYSAVGSALWVSAPGGEEGYGDVGIPAAGFQSPWLAVDSYKRMPALMTSDRTGCSAGYSAQWFDFTVFGNTVRVAKNPFNGTSHLSTASPSYHAENLNCNYNATTYGTASATAITSGAAALLLELKPTLTGREIAYVLAKTAYKNHEGDTSSNLRVNGTNVRVQSGWVDNGAGIPFNAKYGFGMVDANAAVQYVKDNSVIMGPRQTPVTVVSSAVLNSAVPSNNATGVSSQLTVTSTVKIETVQVKLNITHSNINNLLIKLTSPANTEAIIYTPASALKGNKLVNFYIRANNFLDETANGTWTLTVIDTASGAAGTLDNWEITPIGY